MKRAVLILSLPAAAIAVTVACGFGDPAPDWSDQLHADSPCYRVDLMDGLDETSTAEVRDTFGCIDHNGQFDALQPTVDALEGNDRDGLAAGIDVAKAVNALPDAGVDPFALAGIAVSMLRAEDRPIAEFLDLFLELVYGAPAPLIRDGEVNETPNALQSGVLAPLAPALQAGAGAMLDTDLDLAHFAGDLLGDPETKRYVRTFGAYTASNDGRVSAPIHALIPDLGGLILAARNPANDHDGRASGDSLRDLADVYAGGRVLDDLHDPAGAILGDVVVRTNLVTHVGQWHRDGHLDTLARQVAFLASVDVDGGALDPGDVSGLHALIRLLHDTNRPMSCDFDLWVTNLHIDLGNLAVAILDLLAGSNPDTLKTGIGILGGVLDWGLSQSILSDVASSGVCPAITPNVAHDLRSIDLIQDDRAADLLVVFLDALDVLKHGDHDRIPDLADAATALENDQGVWPLEELVRDIDDEPAVTDLVALVPVLIDPDAYGVTAGDEPAVDLQDILGLLTWLFADDAGRSGWERSKPLIQPVIAEDGTWVAIDNAARVMSADDSQLGKALELVPPLLAIDPDLVTLDQLAPLLRDDAVAAPLLRVVETPGVADALLATTPTTEDEVPLGFSARLVVDGTVDELLTTVDVLFRALAPASDDTDP
jgi:hypothetical protein